jgi:26 proteasome complex subunit DSS1
MRPRAARLRDTSRRVDATPRVGSAARARATMATNAPQPPLARDAAVDLECDDEFEEFTAKKWDETQNNATTRDATQWEEDWDDGDVRDDFSKQLRAELTRADGT